MSHSQQSKDIKDFLPYIPSNRGYIVNGKKLYGKGSPINMAQDVKFLDSRTNHVHIWMKRGYMEKKLDSEDTEWDAFTNRIQKRPLVSSRDMRPCPAELSNTGMCQERFDPKHRKYYYHYAKYDNDGVVCSDNDNRVRCIYDLNGKFHCWERANPEHMKVFSHK